MSIYATKWAYAQPVKPAGRKFVLVALADFADAEGRAFPGADTIATMTGQDERSVRRHIDALEKSGHIKCVERRRKDGSRTTDEVWLQAPAEVLKPHVIATGQSVRKSTGQNARLPDQPDTLTAPTGQSVHTNRSNCPGQPGNLSGRTEPSLNHQEEPSPEPPPPALAAPAAEAAPGQDQDQNDQAQSKAGEGGDHTRAQVQVPANAQPGNATSTEDVPPAAPRVRPSDFQRLVDAWNAHRGTLPAVEQINEGRKKAMKSLLRDCGGDVDKALGLLADAAKEVAQDEYYQQRRYGFDNVVPSKVLGRAEAWRSRNPSTPASTLTTTPGALRLSDFHAGQRVTFRGYGYTVEAVGETSVILDDDLNGRTFVRVNSDEWHGLKLPGGPA